MLIAGVLAVLLAVAGAVAWSTGSDRNTSTPDATTDDSARPGGGPASPAPSGTVTTDVPQPPPIADPLAFGRAAAVMLWTFDARAASRAQQLAGMRTWMTSETKYADWDSVQAQVPDPLLWSRLKDNAQHATAITREAHFPSAFKQALAENPSALTEAYIYAVTVTGTQQLAWTGGGGVEERQVTLAVQCRPGTDCRLVAIAPTVAP
ncbi:hypothetical protein ACFWXK_20550 [Streptomyces sp. NPDC059070]|uniref:hypothetical protein n=1 Tax=Streptomyces sp. NPDC059070 TaxID=3346713 RepID=UPI0036A69FE4